LRRGTTRPENPTNKGLQGGDMTPTKTPTPVIEGVARLVPAADALDQAGRLDTLAEHLEGVSPQDAEAAALLRAVARHLRSERTE
jgi:hypothetical protein